MTDRVLEVIACIGWLVLLTVLAFFMLVLIFLLVAVSVPMLDLALEAASMIVSWMVYQ